MHPDTLWGFNKPTTDFNNMMNELDSIKDDIRKIKDMQVSDEVKVLILAELQEQINEVKEKMHNYIDSL